MIEVRHSGNWEAAVRDFRKRGNQAEVSANFFDLPVRVAAARFAASEEFAEATHVLGTGESKRLLDLGAGNGVSSYAWAGRGWDVVALEPDPSLEVGAGAIKELALSSSLPVRAVRAIAEALPIASRSIDAAYARQVLHHSRVLPLLFKELARVLKPGARFLSVRDHVVDSEAQREEFLNGHPLHKHYGGEWAYSVGEYLEAAQGAGFRVLQEWGPEQSVMNYYPGSAQELFKRQVQVAQLTWQPFGRWLSGWQRFRRFAVARAQARHRQAGRLYSFLFELP